MVMNICDVGSKSRNGMTVTLVVEARIISLPVRQRDTCVRVTISHVPETHYQLH